MVRCRRRHCRHAALAKSRNGKNVTMYLFGLKKMRIIMWSSIVHHTLIWIEKWFWLEKEQHSRGMNTRRKRNQQQQQHQNDEREKNKNNNNNFKQHYNQLHSVRLWGHERNCSLLASFPFSLLFSLRLWLLDRCVSAIDGHAM